jgi:hypothetical protein
MKAAFAEVVNETGCAEVSPLILEFGTYSQKKKLMKETMEEITPDFSMPSLRIDVFGQDSTFGQIAVSAQKRNITIAVEGNSQRLREVVSKGITEEDVLRTLSNAIAAGYQTAKCYMICNLPGENINDHREMYELAEKMDALRKSVGSNIRIRFSWKPLTIQANAPYQWFPARVWSDRMWEIVKKIKALGFGCQIGDELKGALGNYLQMAELADDIAGEILLDAVEESDCVTWGALSKRFYESLERQLVKHGRTFFDYYRAKAEDESFAWDIVDTRVTKAYLLRHYKNVLRRSLGPMKTEDAKEAGIPIYGDGFLERFGGCQIGCTICGACDDDSHGHASADHTRDKSKPVEASPMLIQMHELAMREDEPIRLTDIHRLDRTSVRQKLIFTGELDEIKRFPSRKHWTYVIRRACFKAGLTIVLDSIKYATDRIQTLKPWFAGREYFEISLVKPEVHYKGLIDRLNPYLTPYGFKLIAVRQVPTSSSIGARKFDAAFWSLEVDQPSVVLNKMIASVKTRDYVPLQFKSKAYRLGAVVTTINLRDVMWDVWSVIDGPALKLMMLVDSTVSPYDVANSVIGSRTDVLRYSANLLGVLNDVTGQGDLFTQLCEFKMPDGSLCDDSIPWELDTPFHDKYCPKHMFRTAENLDIAARETELENVPLLASTESVNYTEPELEMAHG